MLLNAFENKLQIHASLTIGESGQTLGPEEIKEEDLNLLRSKTSCSVLSYNFLYPDDSEALEGLASWPIIERSSFEAILNSRNIIILF